MFFQVLLINIKSWNFSIFVLFLKAFVVTVEIAVEVV
jgi:hypothetical protein